MVVFCRRTLPKRRLLVLDPEKQTYRGQSRGDAKWQDQPIGQQGRDAEHTANPGRDCRDGCGNRPYRLPGNLPRRRTTISTLLPLA